MMRCLCPTARRKSRLGRRPDECKRLDPIEVGRDESSEQRLLPKRPRDVCRILEECAQSAAYDIADSILPAARCVCQDRLEIKGSWVGYSFRAVLNRFPSNSLHHQGRRDTRFGLSTSFTAFT